MESSETIEPCPYCFTDPEEPCEGSTYTHEPANDFHDCWVGCEECGTHGPGRTSLEGAIEDWNRVGRVARAAKEKA